MDLSDDPARILTNPGRFTAGQDVTLTAGAAERIKFDYVPYDAETWRGKRTAVLRLQKADGSPAGGREVEVSWFDGHYGNLTVFSGKVPENGQIVLEGVSDKRHAVMPRGPFIVSIDQLQRVGTFGFEGDASRQEFTFRLPPAVGEVVPDVELVDLESGQAIRLSELRGKLVCLEFWASWCGPCREPLEKLNTLAGAKREDWKDRVAILQVSIDEQREAAREHLRTRGYGNLRPLWASGEPGSAGWESSAAKAFGIGGVPTSVLIDRDGRLLWRGHPAAGSDKKDLAARLEEAVGE